MGAIGDPISLGNVNTPIVAPIPVGAVDPGLGTFVVQPPPVGGGNQTGPYTGKGPEGKRQKMRAAGDLHNIDGLGMSLISMILLKAGDATIGTFPGTAQAYKLKTNGPVILYPSCSSATGASSVQDYMFAVSSMQIAMRSRAALASAEGYDLGALRSRSGKLYLPYGGVWYIQYAGASDIEVMVIDARDPALVIQLMSETGEHKPLNFADDAAIGAGATTILNANRNRYLAIITNTGTVDMRVGVGFVPTAVRGTLLKALGGNMTLNGPGLLTGFVQAISTGANTTASAQEWV